MRVLDAPEPGACCVCALGPGATWLVDIQSRLHVILSENTNKVSGVRRMGDRDFSHGKTWIWEARPQPFKDNVTERSFVPGVSGGKLESLHENPKHHDSCLTIVKGKPLRRGSGLAETS